MLKKIIISAALLTSFSAALIANPAKADSVFEGEKIAQDLLASGKVYNKFLDMVKIQEGDVKYIEDWKNLKRSKYRYEVNAENSGYIYRMNAYDF